MEIIREDDIRDIKKMRDVKYTEDDLIQMLKDFYKENGRIPVMYDFMNNPKYPHNSTYKNRFGSWSKAISIANFDIKDKKRSIRSMDYTDDELLDILKQFYKETGKIPSQTDFMSNKKYPNFKTYTNHFRSWSNALKLAGFGVDDVVKKGILQCGYYKGRLAELIIFNSFKDRHKAIDFSGINCNSVLDGMCPKGKTYDVKSAKLIPNKNYPDSRGWFFHFRNKQIEKIEYFYLVALDENYENLYYIWLIPRELIDRKDTLYINFNNAHIYDKYLVDFDKCNLDFIDSIGKGD